MMRLKLGIIFILSLQYFCIVHGVIDFVDPEEPGVEFGDFNAESQLILMDEGNRENIILTRVTGAVSKPNLTGFSLGSESDLIPFVEPDTDGINYVIKIGKSVDYENGQTRQFIFDVGDGASKKRIRLNIINIDDNPPELTMDDDGCTMNENDPNARCKFHVHDVDGWLDQMDFTNIIGNKNEREIFKMVYDTTPSVELQDSDVYLVLQDGKQLDYEETTLYTFAIAALDGAAHPTTPANLPVIVVVGDLPDRPPGFTRIEYSMKIDEEQETTFNVSAKDGDYGINSPIHFEIIDAEEFEGYFHKIGDDIDGNFLIDPIDRDGITPDLDINLVTFSIRAYEEDCGNVPDETCSVTERISLTITDIDDNIPEITVIGSTDHEMNFAIDEGSTKIDPQIQISDIDLGENAMYNVVLENMDEGGPDYATAFSIVPNIGHSTTRFSLGVSNSAALDYEDPEWQTIKFQIRSKGVLVDTMSDVLNVTIFLNDLNDEVPIFADSPYAIEVNETVQLGEIIFTAKATDRDAADVDNVQHTIVGNSALILAIEALGGDITTTQVNAFDYEKNQEVSVQIMASDTVNHTVSTQLTIRVLDVNDEQPTIKVDPGQLRVEENQKDGESIMTEVKITASDPDGGADLKFSIDWTTSYGLKNAQQVSIDEYHCIAVETIPIDGKTSNVQAQFSITETVPGNSPDFEKFDTLVIFLNVTDTDQTVGTPFYTTAVSINIVNINDNPPQFTDDTLSRSLTVTEGTSLGQEIGTIKAFDVDNEPDEQFKFTLTPLGDTPADWIAIDPALGALTVTSTDIDCDIGPRYNLTYQVTVADHDDLTSEPLEIAIAILDINDVQPVIPPVPGDGKILIDEDNQLQEPPTNRPIVYTLNPTDGDRDSPNNQCNCEIQSTAPQDIVNRFVIENKEIKVLLRNGATLDREQNPDGFKIPVRCYDLPENLASRREATAELSVQLRDINDNIPVITSDTKITAREDMTQGETLSEIVAVDQDDGANGKVDFELHSIIWEGNGEEHNDLFVLIDGNPDEKKTGIQVNAPLTGFFGTFTLLITTSDQGIDKLSSTNNVTLEVAKYVFEPPTIIFPADNVKYYLYTSQTAGQALKMYNLDIFPNFQATDTQTNSDSVKFDVKFSYEAVEGTQDIFTMETDSIGNSLAQLQIRTTDNDLPIDIVYQLRVTATIDTPVLPGEASHSKQADFSIQFFNMDSDPTFNVNATDDILFDEQNAALVASIPEATYPDIEDLQQYYILEKTIPDEAVFLVNSFTGEISLTQALDFDRTPEYDLIIRASNSPTLKPFVDDGTRLYAHITVVDVNNHDPEFGHDTYFGTILTNAEKRGNIIIETDATDQDTTSTLFLKYSIENTTLFASDDSIKNILTPFLMDATNGRITLNFDIQATMQGYFTFDITVKDEDQRANTAQATVYIVTDANTVNFKFDNPLETVISKQSQIKTILDDFFHYTSNIENPTEGGGETTVAPVYFIDEVEHQPRNGSEILKTVTNVTVFISLKKVFANETLTLLSFVTESPTENIEEMLKAWLIGVSVVLGALLLILFIAFLLKTRELKHKIKTLLKPKFGSQESGLNRQGVSVPTTNKHAVEGSNPVFNNEIDTKEIDRVSMTSGDSDLIGVEDNPEFEYDNKDSMKNGFIDRY